MKREEINIRDPFVLAYDGKYYMYGSDGSYAWEGGNSFPCYVSTNLEDWDGPITAFKRPDDFWATENFWAPEVHEYKGAFYMFASFHSAKRGRASQILKSDKPQGPYSVWSEPITPEGWECLDGTLFVDSDGIPYMVFCHEWIQVGDGEICAVRLSDDLKRPVGEPKLLFNASEAKWVVPNDLRIINGKACMITDGPFFIKDNRILYMTWSSAGKDGYTVGVAKSENGCLFGPWKQIDEPLFNNDGGHGMFFKSFEGKNLFVIHCPNSNPYERPTFFEYEIKDGKIELK